VTRLARKAHSNNAKARASHVSVISAASVSSDFALFFSVSLCLW